MAEDRKPEPADQASNETAPHNPGVDSKPGDTATNGKPSDGAPYDKKNDPAQQPS